MKNHIIPFLACLLLLASCGKSNEEQAEALIQEIVKSNLFHPETYKPTLIPGPSAESKSSILKKFILKVPLHIFISLILYKRKKKRRNINDTSSLKENFL